MPHILDNPVWHALRTHNGPLGRISGDSAYFLPQISPFVATEGETSVSLPALHDAIPFDNVVIFVTSRKADIPQPWKQLAMIGGYQMLYEVPDMPATEGMAVVPLTTGHVPEMLALTSLTNPGPFEAETIRFGHYEGIFDNGHLVAMAGQRMHPEGFAEISAVCTHPDHLGKGYARHLLLRQVTRIRQAGETPFLHVKGDNTRAIGLYESLGFAIRTEVFFYVLTKNSARAAPQP